MAKRVPATIVAGAGVKGFMHQKSLFLNGNAKQAKR